MNRWFILLLTVSTATVASIDRPGLGNRKIVNMARQTVKKDTGAARPDSRYEMRVLASPAELEAGKTSLLRFRPTKLMDEDEPVELKPVRGEHINAVLMSADLNWCKFLDVQSNPPGLYSVEIQPPASGPYMLFSEYHPRGGKARMDRLDLLVSGPASNTKTWSGTEQTEAKTGNYRVRLDPETGSFLAGKTNTIQIRIECGKMQPISAACAGLDAQLVVIREDGTAFAHSLAESGEGMVEAKVPFGKPGLYRAFLKFNLANKAHYTDFTLRAHPSGPIAYQGSENARAVFTSTVSE